MTDNATSLGFRLRVIASVIGEDCPRELKLQDIYYTCRDAAARIAELETERDYHRTAYDSALLRMSQLTRDCRANEAHVAELEQRLGEATGRIETDAKLIAELEAKLRQFEADLEDPTLSVGEAYAWRSEHHGPGKKP